MCKVKGEKNMNDKIKNIIEKGVVILIIYAVFTIYLMMACERIEQLDNKYQENENISVKVGD